MDIHIVKEYKKGKGGRLVLPDKILIVDDEPDICNLAKRVLETEGCKVIVTSDGDEALQKAESKMPDLILLDVVMPGKSGLEVCKILKAEAKTKHIPVVMFTVLGRDVDKKLSGEAGADGHLIKPFNPESLLTEIKGRLEEEKAWKFSKKLGLEHNGLEGKKILFEFDPSTPYERLVRDFTIECSSQGTKVLVITPAGSFIRKALEEDGVEFIDLTSDTMLSPIIEKYPKGALSLVYDSFSDLILLENVQAAYKFSRDALKMLSEPRITALFLLNSSAHETKEVNSLRGLFNNKFVYGKQGITGL